MKLACTRVHVKLQLLGANAYLPEMCRYRIKIWLFMKTICAPLCSFLQLCLIYRISFHSTWKVSFTWKPDMSKFFFTATSPWKLVKLWLRCTTFFENSTTRLHNCYRVPFRLEVFPLCKVIVIIYPFSFLRIPLFFSLTSPHLLSFSSAARERLYPPAPPVLLCSDGALIKGKRKGKERARRARTKKHASATLCARFVCVFSQSLRLRL